MDKSFYAVIGAGLVLFGVVCCWMLDAKCIGYVPVAAAGGLNIGRAILRD